MSFKHLRQHVVLSSECVFQAPQAACGRSVTRHSLPEDAFKIPTFSCDFDKLLGTSTCLAGNRPEG